MIGGYYQAALLTLTHLIVLLDLTGFISYKCKITLNSPQYYPQELALLLKKEAGDSVTSVISGCDLFVRLGL